MSYLNKDQLIEISNLLLHGLGESVKRVATFQKIQCLIKNYCEHDDLKDVGADYKVCRLCGEEVHENE